MWNDAKKSLPNHHGIFLVRVMFCGEPFTTIASNDSTTFNFKRELPEGWVVTHWMELPKVTGHAKV